MIAEILAVLFFLAKMPVEGALGMWERNGGKAELPKIVLQPNIYNQVTLIKIYQLYNITSLFYFNLYTHTHTHTHRERERGTVLYLVPW